MRTRRQKVRLACFVAACGVHLLTTQAAAEPAPSEANITDPSPAPSERLRMRDPSVLTLKSGTRLALPPGRYFTENAFAEGEAKLKEAQEKVTRLDAENASFRKSAAAWRPGWVMLASATLSGIATGIWLRDKFD